MASSVSSASLLPIYALQQRPALRQADAGVPAFDADALRPSQDAVPPPQPTVTENENPSRTDTGPRQPPAGSGTPLLAQLLDQDREPGRPSASDAARAYSRFAEAPSTGLVVDLPARIDVKA